MVDDFYENLTALTDNLSDIVFSRYAEVTKVEGYSCECKENESGVVHIDVPIINNFEVEVGDFIILGFVDNDLYNPVALGMLEPRGGGGGDVPIVTAWEQTLSDSKVPSEKLTKNTLDLKVDKETGKGLSTEDYTTAEKTKLAGVEAEANKIIVDDDLSSTSMNPLTNRRTYRWLTLKADKSSLSTVATSGSYNDLTDKPSIPSKTSDLTNDGDGTNPFLTQHQSLSGYLKTTDIVDDLTTEDSTKPLSAKQGKILKDSITPLNVWTTVYEKYGCKLKVNTVLGEAQLEVFSAVNITTANTDLGIATITDSYMPPQTMRVVAHNVVTAVTILIFTHEGKLYVRSTKTGSKTVNGVFRYVY